MELSAKEIYLVFAALCAMVEEIHAPQDTLTEEQWKDAQELYNRIAKAVNEQRQAFEIAAPTGVE